MFTHWDNCNRIHKGNNCINVRKMHTILCTPLLPRTPMVWLGTCSFSRSEQLRRIDWKSLPLKNTWFLLYWRKMWSCDTVFRKTTSLEYSGKNFFCHDETGNKFQYFICYGADQGSCTPIMCDSRLWWWQWHLFCCFTKT